MTLTITDILRKKLESIEEMTTNYSRSSKENER
jgi:hypothetical protein